MDWEQRSLINELTQGKELAEQLRNHLNPSSSSLETRQFLVEKILSTYDKALSKLNLDAFMAQTKPTITTLESPHSCVNGSPRSDSSDQDQSYKDVFKKRKTLPQWSEQVKVCSGNGLDGPLDDGYCWRKYGQKDILGSKFPRGYYRCTHRGSQGCLATKQVQRSSSDPTIFEVTYRGKHTCNQVLDVATAATKSTSKQVSKEPEEQQQYQAEKPRQAQEMLLDFGSRLIVKTEDLDSKEDIFPSFSLPYTSSESVNVENDIFLDANFMKSFSPTFISPATSESNYFSVSPCHMTSYGLGQNMPSSESDLAEIISAPTSVTNSPVEDFDFSSLDQADFDANFPFDQLFS